MQSPLTSLHTYDVTHSRLVTHFRVLKCSKKKLIFFNIAKKLGLLYIFNLKHVFKCLFTYLYH